MGGKSMRFLSSQPDHIPIPVQAAVLWDPPD
uniref:Uncharacterized protein n=1 Tax=Colobus angolensis palliatus TaxID=336983 RepID=A0A2K5HCI7_COLAP